MAKTATQEFLDKILETVPEDKKEGVRALYSKAQDEISATQRSLDEEVTRVKDIAQKQTDWWNAHKDTVEENKRLKAAGGGGTGNVDSAKVTEQLGALEDRVMGQGLALITTTADLAIGHYQEFGERLNTQKLAADAIKANKPLQQFYDESVATRRSERAAADLKKQLEEAEARGKKAGVEETTQRLGNAQMPFPGHSAPAATTLSGLKKPAEGASKPDVLADAVATANAVVAREAGSTA